MVNQTIAEVCQKVNDDLDRGQDQNRTLYDREIPGFDGVHDQRADARPAEDRLDNDLTAIRFLICSATMVMIAPSAL